MNSAPIHSKLLSRAPIFVALDVDDANQALHLAKSIKNFVGGFKVGPRLTYKYGSDFVKSIAEVGPVFVDNKYHDIPSTVIAALRTTFESGASFATVHASNGPEAMREIAAFESDCQKIRNFRILCVTVLTSFHESNLPSNWRSSQVGEHVFSLAQDVLNSGLKGLVCSPEEVYLLRKKFPQADLVTPGIRLPTNERGDQSRIMGPREALAAGASALVIGRPIVAAANPVQAAADFFKLTTEIRV
jgi:orotidine-5'-phosphate decarboxylase